MNTTPQIQLQPRFSIRPSRAIELTRDDLYSRVPSIYAEQAHVATSNRYSFFPTGNVVEALRESGWSPVIAQQQKAREADRQGFQKHLIRFHRRNDLDTAPLGDSRLELVMMNSHDGGCAFRLFAGVFRFVCANGLIVADASYGAVSIRHSNRSVDEVITAAQKIATDSDRIGGRLDQFRERTLSDEERLGFATRALNLRYDSVERAPVYPSVLLDPVRAADRGNSLWHTFNVVQERMMRGSRPDHLKAVRENRRSARVRGLTGLDSQLNLNRDLWELAASYLN
jgi:hypothetical protein